MTDKDKIADLEKRIAQLSADNTLVRYYKSLKKQVDDMARMMGETTIDMDSLRDKNDKFFDLYKFFIKESLGVAKNLKEMEELVAPMMKKDDNIREDSTVEKHIFGKD